MKKRRKPNHGLQGQPTLRPDAVEQKLHGDSQTAERLHAYELRARPGRLSEQVPVPLPSPASPGAQEARSYIAHGQATLALSVPETAPAGVLHLVSTTTTTNNKADGDRPMEESSSDKAAAKRHYSRNILKNAHLIDLVRWLEKRGPYHEYIALTTLASEAEQALGFKVTDNNIEAALRDGKIPFPVKPTAPKSVEESVLVLARVFIQHLSELGQTVPAELLAITRPVQETA